MNDIQIAILFALAKAKQIQNNIKEILKNNEQKS